MKDLTYILLIIICFSCSNDDDIPDRILPKELIGLWEPQLYKNICPPNPENTIYYSNCRKNEIIEFLSDGTFKEQTWVTNDDSCNKVLDVSGSWYVKSNVLIIYRSLGFGYHTDYEFWEVSSTQLKLRDPLIFGFCDDNITGNKGYTLYLKKI